MNNSNHIYCIAFDCFGTLFDMTDVPREEIAAYVNHVRKGDFTPYGFACVTNVPSLDIG